MKDTYWVVGNPIEHSRSPMIHHEFALQCNQNLSYTTRLLEIEQFNESVRSFFVEDGKGMNVTVPFKEMAFELADKLDTFAKKAGAVNTLAMDSEGILTGYNTDGIGLVADLVNNLGIDLTGKRILVLGAGGAVRGVLAPILAKQPDCLHITNRTHSKAEILAKEFENSVIAVSLANLNSSYDLIINGTSASLSGQLIALPDSVLTPASCVYDMMYGAQVTPFNQWAKSLGVTRVYDGLGMLVEQAAAAFEIWRGCKPDTAPVIAKIRTQL